MILSCLYALTACGGDEVLVTFDGGDVRMSEIKPLLEALTEVEGYKEGSEEYEKYRKEFIDNLLYAKLYEKEHPDYSFTYSEETYENYLDAVEENALKQYNMGLRKYANAQGQTLAYFKAYVRLSLYKGAVEALGEKAGDEIVDDKELYEEYLHSVYDASPDDYKRVAGCDGYLIVVDSRGDSEEEKKSVYDEVAGYITRLDDGEDFFDIVKEVQTKYPNGILSLFQDGLMFSGVIYNKDYSSYTNSRRYIYEILKSFDEGEYSDTPVELISNDITEIDEETGEEVTTPGEYFGYCIVMAKNVNKADRRATFEEAREDIIASLPEDYVSGMGELYRAKLEAKYHVVRA